MWLPPAVFVRIAPDLEAMQVTGGNVLLALRRCDPADPNTMPIASTAHPVRPGDHVALRTGDGNTVAIVSTAHFEMDMDDDDQAAAYRDEPDLCADPVCIALGHGTGPDGCPR